MDEYPNTDTQQLRALIRQARKDAPPVDKAAVSQGLAPRKGRAYRELFQLVREHLGGTGLEREENRTLTRTAMTEAVTSSHDAVKIGIVSISDRASTGVYEDKGLPALQDWLGRALHNPIQFEARLIPDEQATISATLIELVNAGCSLVLTTGGTGPALRDVTPEATLAVAHKEMPGFGEQMRQISLKFVPTAILSRQVAVIRDPEPHHQPARPAQGHCADAGRPERRRGRHGGARHLCRRAVLRRPDRRAISGNARRGLQGVSPSLGTAPGTRRLSALCPRASRWWIASRGGVAMSRFPARSCSKSSRAAQGHHIVTVLGYTWG